jgi:large repetitive protein
MASQGPNTTASWITVAGPGDPWNFPTNAQFSDDIYADVTLVAIGSSSEPLQGSAWGFTIPATATIDGIQVDWEIVGDPQVVDNNVRLVRPPATLSSNLATSTGFPAVDTVRTYGGPATLWGLAWTPANINSAVFAARFGVGVGAPGDGFAAVDQGKVTVFFTDAGSSRVQWLQFGVGAPQ